MEYKQKLWLNKYQYLAILENNLVIVTVNKKGDPIRYAIFGNKKEGGDENENISSHC